MADPLSTFTGISSGMDWRSLVDQLVRLERRPAEKLQTRIDANTKRKEALGAFQAQLQALKDAADTLTGQKAGATSPFMSFSSSATGVNAAGRSVVTAVATAGATGGSYAIQVTALARAQKLTGGRAMGGSGIDATTALGTAGQLTLTPARAGATPVAIDVAATDTLAAVRDKINAANTGATPSGVQAAIVGVAPNDQRLVLTSTATGVQNGFALADDQSSALLGVLGLDAGATDASARPQLVAAGDAAFTVDGLAVTRATNAVSDLLPGVTLTLGAEGSSTVEVTRLNGSASAAMRAFVDGYNAVQKTIAAAARDPKAPLANDPMLRTLRGALSGVVVTAAVPASAGGTAGVADDLTTLAALGVSLQKDGTLAFEEAKFAAAAERRLPELQALLGDRLQALAAVADGAARPLVGLIDQREQGIELQNARMTDRIADIDARLEKKREQLVAQYARFEGSLGRLKAIGDQMGAQFAGLNRSNDD